ncbi:hypothetical protein ABPG74_021892 [Tetrahymena malaccensis]
MRKSLIILIIAYLLLLQIVQCKKQLRTQNTEENNKGNPFLMQSGIKMDQDNNIRLIYYKKSNSGCFKICQDIGGTSLRSLNGMYMCCEIIITTTYNSRYQNTQCNLINISCLADQTIIQNQAVSQN